MTSFFKTIKIKKQQRDIKRQSFNIASSIHKMRSIEKEIDKKFIDQEKLNYYHQIIEDHNRIINSGLSTLIELSDENTALIRENFKKDIKKLPNVVFFPLFSKEPFVENIKEVYFEIKTSTPPNTSQFNFLNNNASKKHANVSFFTEEDIFQLSKKEREAYIDFYKDFLKKEKQLVFLKHFSNKTLKSINEKWDLILDNKKQIVVKYFEDLISDLECHLFFCKDIFDLKNNLDNPDYILFCLDVIDLLLNHFKILKRGQFNNEHSFEKINFISFLKNRKTDDLKEDQIKLIKEINSSFNNVFIKIN